jgi:hypothetical protein
MNSFYIPRFSTNESKDGIVFTIQEGKFSGMQYLYGEVSIKEPVNDAAAAVLSFGYTIMKNPDGFIVTENDHNEILNLLGDIINGVVLGLDEYGHPTIFDEVEYNDVTDELARIL